IERVRQWLEPAWLAHVAGFAVVRAIRWVVGLKSPVAIVRHVNLREPVAVKVPPAGAGGPQSVVETRFTSDIDKVPAAIAVGLVVEQDEPVVPGQEQVGPTVVVVVERGVPVRILERAGQPDFRAYVFKLPAAEVAVQATRVAHYILAVVVTAPGEENVEQSVAVEVEQGDASAQRLDNGE